MTLRLVPKRRRSLRKVELTVEVDDEWEDVPDLNERIAEAARAGVHHPDLGWRCTSSSVGRTA